VAAFPPARPLSTLRGSRAQSSSSPPTAVPAFPPQVGGYNGQRVTGTPSSARSLTNPLSLHARRPRNPEAGEQAGRERRAAARREALGPSPRPRRPAPHAVPGGSAVAPAMLSAGIDAAVVIVMPEIPGFGRVDPLPAPRAPRLAGRDNPRPRLPHLLMLPPVASPARRPSRRHSGRTRLPLGGGDTTNHGLAVLLVVAARPLPVALTAAALAP
jgi:hypothetical protein